MGHIYKSNAHLLLDAFQLDLHILAQLQIQCAQGLIQKQHLGPVDQCSGDGHPLLLAAGKSVRPAVFKALQTDNLQHLQHALPNLLLGDLQGLLRIFRVLAPLHPQSKGDVLKHVQVGKQGVFLEYGVDLPLIGRNVINPHTVKEDVSRRWCREAANHPQRGGLAAPAGPKQCEEFFVIDVKVDVV